MSRDLGVHLGGLFVLEFGPLDLHLFHAGNVLGHFQLRDQVRLLGQELLVRRGQTLHAHAARRRGEGFREHFVRAAELEEEGERRGDFRFYFMAYISKGIK